MTTVEELDRKAADFLAGRWGRLTTEEIETFREAQADPDGSKWDRAHVGQLVGIDEIELAGILFVEFPNEEELEASRARLLKMVGAHPVTPARVWRAVKRLGTRTSAPRGAAETFVARPAPQIRIDAAETEGKA